MRYCSRHDTIVSLHEHDQQHKRGCHICTVCVYIQPPSPADNDCMSVDPSNLLHGMSLRDHARQGTLI